MASFPIKWIHLDLTGFLALQLDRIRYDSVSSLITLLPAVSSNGDWMGDYRHRFHYRIHWIGLKRTWSNEQFLSTSETLLWRANGPDGQTVDHLLLIADAVQWATFGYVMSRRRDACVAPSHSITGCDSKPLEHLHVVALRRIFLIHDQFPTRSILRPINSAPDQCNFQHGS